MSSAVAKVVSKRDVGPLVPEAGPFMQRGDKRCLNCEGHASDVCPLSLCTGVWPAALSSLISPGSLFYQHRHVRSPAASTCALPTLIHDPFQGQRTMSLFLSNLHFVAAFARLISLISSLPSLILLLILILAQRPF